MPSLGRTRASAIADRLVHNGIIIRITGASFRTQNAIPEDD